MTPEAEVCAAGDDSPPVDPFTAPEGFCPKCVAPWIAAETACRACGVLAAHVASSSVRPPPELVRRWQALLERWSEPTSHRAFLAYAQTTQQLERAARFYRIHLARHAGDAAAEQGLATVVRMALVPTRLERQPPGDSRKLRLVSGAVFVSMAVLCVLIVASAIRLQQGRSASVTTFPETPSQAHAHRGSAH